MTAPVGGEGSSSFEGLGAHQIVQTVFDNAWGKANSASSKTETMFNDALKLATGAPSVVAASSGFTPNVVEPNVAIPHMAEGASLARYNEISTAVINQLVPLFKGYIDDYFPNECGYLEAAQQWVCDAIKEGGTGVNAVVEDQIWQRDRDRVLAEVNRAVQDTLSTFAARGYPLPPGAAAHQIQLAQVEAQNKIAQQSRDVAIKAFETEIENVRFAVEKAIGLYTAAMSAAADYIKALSIGAQAGIQLVPSVTDSQSRLISAANEYYRSRISVEELRMKAKVTDTEFLQQARLKTGDWSMDLLKARIDAAVEAARALAQQAAAALNGLHASASTGASMSKSIGFSYGGDVTADVEPDTEI